MNFIIDNREFSYDIGIRLAKAKHGDKPLKGTEDIWDEVQPITFKEAIAFKNMEERRIAINCVGIQTIFKEIDAKLLNRETLIKKANYVKPNGELVLSEYADTYELYEIQGSQLNLTGTWGGKTTFHIVRCKCTSTDREYLIWVDANSVRATNNMSTWGKDVEPINAIQAIAWTIQTTLPKEGIEKIIRQGDCIFLKPNNFGMREPKYGSHRTRHLTEGEYRKLLVAES